MPALSERFQCRHILADGHRCGSPALRQENFCFYHHTTRRPPASRTRTASTNPEAFELRMPDDRTSIQLSIGDVLNRIAQGTLNQRTASLLLYGLQIASNNLPRRREPVRTAEPERCNVVEEVDSDEVHGLLAPLAELKLAQGERSLRQIWEEIMQDTGALEASESFPQPAPAVLPQITAATQSAAAAASDQPSRSRPESRPKSSRVKTFGPRSRGRCRPSTAGRKLAPMSNPYAATLAGQDARAVLASTPGLLHQAACSLSPEQLEAPIAPGKWSVREIAAHLADCEIAFSFRLRQTLAGPAEGASHVTIQPFDQDAWAQHYVNYDLPSALATFRALREWNLKLTGALSKAELASEALHPERGPLTFQSILDTMAGHDLNHLAQVQKVAAAQGSQA